MDNIQLDLSNYDERKNLGDIFWTWENGAATLNVKQFDSAHKEIGVPLQSAWSVHQLDRLHLAGDSKIIELKNQKIAIDEQIAAIRKEQKGLYKLIEADVKKVEAENEDKE